MDATKGSQEFTFYLVSQLLCHCQLDVDIHMLPTKCGRLPFAYGSLPFAYGSLFHMQMGAGFFYPG
jgi:hypothetical protein